MTTATRDLNRSDVERAYRIWSTFYDAACGPLFGTAHHALAEAANAKAALSGGGRLLEVGVGTGLMFDRYHPAIRITGIDISADMLARARARCATGRYPQVEALDKADVHALPYADGAFDMVAFPFVLTLVSQPELALSEAARVLRPGGEVVVVSHFQTEAGWGRWLETALSPLCARLGLRPDFPLERLTGWAADDGRLALVEARRLPPLGLYTLVRLKRR